MLKISHWMKNTISLIMAFLMIVVLVIPVSVFGQAGELSAEIPAVIWAADPTQPGQTLSVQGDSFIPGSTIVKVGRLQDKSVNIPKGGVLIPEKSDIEALADADLIQINNYSLSAVIPDSLKDGELCVWIETPAGTAKPIILNRALPQWREDQYAAPGKTLRIFGRNLNGPDVKAYMSSISSSSGEYLKVISKTDYTLTVNMPSRMASGEYNLWVNNGYGGKFGWGDPIKVTVGKDPKSIWHTTSYDVTSYGADKTGTTDSTVAIQNTLNKIKTKSGGVAYFPNGTYLVNGTLEVFPKTTLKGQSRTGVLLKDSATATLRDAMLFGETEFALDGISIEINKCINGIAAPKYRIDRNLGLTWWFPVKVRNPLNPVPHPWKPSDTELNKYAFQGVAKDIYINNSSVKSYMTDSMKPAGMNTVEACVTISGDNVNITNSFFAQSDGHPTLLFGCKYLKVQNNKYDYLQSKGWTPTEGCEFVVWEKNTLDGHAYDSSEPRASGFFFQYGANRSDSLYIADNYIHDVLGNNQSEGICFDSAPSDAADIMCAYPISATQDTVKIDLNRAYTGEKSDPIGNIVNNYFAGNTITIIAGKGKGQYRFITTNTQDNINIDKPWDVIPDSTSCFLVEKVCRDALVVNNTIERVGRPILAWGHCHNFIFAGNTIGESSSVLNIQNADNWNNGIREISAHYPTSSIFGRTELYNMYLNNTINSGGIDATGDQFIKKDSVGKIMFEGTLFMKSIFRGNTLNNGAFFTLADTGATDYGKIVQTLPIIDGVLIEQNTISSGEAAVNFGNKYNTSIIKVNNTVIRENVVGTNKIMSGLGIDTVLCPNYYLTRENGQTSNYKLIGEEAKVKRDDIVNKILGISLKDVYSLKSPDRLIIESKGSTGQLDINFNVGKLELSKYPIWDISIYAPGYSDAVTTQTVSWFKKNKIQLWGNNEEIKFNSLLNDWKKNIKKYSDDDKLLNTFMKEWIPFKLKKENPVPLALDFEKNGDYLTITGLDSNSDGILDYRDMVAWIKVHNYDKVKATVATIVELSSKYLKVPEAPVLLVPVQSEWGVAQLSWKAVPKTEYYNVYRSDASGGTYELIAASISEVTYKDKILPGHDYYYMVKAVNYLGESKYSNEVAVPFKVKDITLTLDKKSIYINHFAQGTINVESTNGNTYKFTTSTEDVKINYTSGDTKTAMVDENCVIKGLDSGLTEISAEVQIGDNKTTVSDSLTVVFPIDLITSVEWKANSDKTDLYSLEPVKLTLEIKTSDGEVYNLDDTTRDVVITYTSSDDKVAVIKKGMLTPKVDGTVILTAKAVINGEEYTFTRNVTVQGKMVFVDDLESYNIGATPPWVNLTYSGGQNAVVVDDNNNKVLEVGGPNNSYITWDKKFDEQNGKMAIGFRVKPIKRQTVVYVGGKNGSAFEFHVMNGEFDLSTGSYLVFKTEAERWYDVRFIFDIPNRCFDYYIDGKLIAAKVKFKDQGASSLNILSMYGTYDDFLGYKTEIKNCFDDFMIYGDTEGAVEQYMVASASSIGWDLYPSQAIDGDKNTIWHSELNGTDNPIWWQLDIGIAKTAGSFELDFNDDESYQGERRNFKVEGCNSPDFNTGVVLLAEQGNTVVTGPTWKSESNDKVTQYRYIRVSKTVKEGGDPGGNIFWCFREFRILPPPSTTVNDRTLGTGLNQFNYVGSWSAYGGETGAYNSDVTYSSTTNNYFTVNFNGTSIKLYAKKDNGHGIGAVSIDAGAETDVDTYSANAVEQALVYTSPTLTSGNHTLKVRVKGTKNASSTGYYIVADYVVVSN